MVIKISEFNTTININEGVLDLFSMSVFSGKPLYSDNKKHVNNSLRCIYRQAILNNENPKNMSGFITDVLLRITRDSLQSKLK